MTQLDSIEQKLDFIIEKLTGPKESPFDRDDNAPVLAFTPGVEKILGPKPEPKDSTNGTFWRNEAAKITQVYEEVPEACATGASVLKAVTGVEAIFCEYNGETVACLKPGLPAWFVPANNFVGANIGGVVRVVLDSKKD